MTGRILKLDLDGHGSTGTRGPKSKPAALPALDRPPAGLPAADSDAAEQAAWLEYAGAPPPEYLAEAPPHWEEDDGWLPDPGPHDAALPVPELLTQEAPFPDAGVLPAVIPATAPTLAEDPRPAPPPVVEAAPAGERTAVFYIDADNQSAQCAAELVAAFRGDFGVGRLRAVIAGNNSGRQIQLWADELAAVAPGIEAVGLDCPSRKDAADLALIMELGASLEAHRRRGELVVVVSRDDLLVGAAERAKAHGCRAYAAYVDSDPPCCRSSRVTTILLPAAARNRDPATPARRLLGPSPNPAPNPAPNPNRAATPAPRPAAPPGTQCLVSTLPSLASAPAASPSPDPAPSPSPGPADPPPPADPALILAELRQLCPPLPSGAYGASQVGQALKQLGLDEKARRRFLASAPGIQSEGKASHKVYRF